MRFDWKSALIAPLLVPGLLALVAWAMSGTLYPSLLMPIVFIPGCVIAYGAMFGLLLPSLFLLSRVVRPTGAIVVLLGAGLGCLVFLPVTWIAWGGSGPDSGPPTEPFLTFLLRWALDWVNVVFPVAGGATAGFYWWLTGRPARARLRAAP